MSDSENGRTKVLLTARRNGIPTTLDDLTTDAAGRLRTDAIANLLGDEEDLDTGGAVDNHEVVALGTADAGGHTVVTGTTIGAIRAIDVNIAATGGGAMTYAAPAFATVGAASGLVLALNANRRYASFVNDSANIIYLGIGAAAVIGSGTRINPNGGSYEIKEFENLTTQVINAIATGAGSNMTVQEAI